MAVSYRQKKQQTQKTAERGTGGSHSREGPRPAEKRGPKSDPPASSGAHGVFQPVCQLVWSTEVPPGGPIWGGGANRRGRLLRWRYLNSHEVLLRSVSSCFRVGAVRSAPTCGIIYLAHVSKVGSAFLIYKFYTASHHGAG